MEGGVALAWRAGEEAREGEGELNGVASLETTPDKDGGEGYRVAVIAMRVSSRRAKGGRRDAWAKNNPRSTF